MGRQIPVDLQTHLQGTMLTTCYLLKITPVDPSFPAYGITDLDRDVVYDDGTGELTYVAAIGMQPASVVASPGLDVDNTETPSLLPEFDIPVSEADIRAGVYDYATFSLMLGNYDDTSQGHVLIHSGTIGQVKTLDDGLSYVNELLGLQQKLKQSVCARDSIACRNTFGSQAKGTCGGAVEELQPCGFDINALWQAGTVTAVGLEPGYSFTDSSLPFPGGAADGVYKLGMVHWTAGANAGRESEVEWNTAAGRVDLAFPTGFPIEIGDEFEIREGCNKIARDDEHGCKRWWGPQWTQHFNGEPDIPIGDAVRNATPGATSSPGSGGSSNIPYDDLAA